MPDREMNWRSLNSFGKVRDSAFYETALCYGQYLWAQGYAARSLLALDRALYAELKSTDPILEKWPLPYAAIRWVVAENREQQFIGNPRVHYQHLADRVKGASIKKWRAWACWAIIRNLSPHLPPDPKHEVIEPSLEEIESALATHGLKQEIDWWQQALE